MIKHVKAVLMILLLIILIIKDFNIMLNPKLIINIQNPNIQHSTEVFVFLPIFKSEIVRWNLHLNTLGKMYSCKHISQAKDDEIELDRLAKMSLEHGKKN